MKFPLPFIVALEKEEAQVTYDDRDLIFFPLKRHQVGREQQRSVPSRLTATNPVGGLLGKG